MEKLVRADAVGAYHALIKYRPEKGKEAIELCQFVNPARFKFKAKPFLPQDYLEYRCKYRRSCSFCKKHGHTIRECKFLANARCKFCHAKGHRASHCPGKLPEQMAPHLECLWSPYLLRRAFVRAVLTQDLEWLDQVLEHEFCLNDSIINVVLGIRDPAFRSCVLQRLFDDWLDESGKHDVIKKLSCELDTCIRKLARYTPVGARRFDRCSNLKLAARARDLRYLYTFCLLQGVEPLQKPNYSFLKIVSKPCRRAALVELRSTDCLVTDLWSIVAAYLYM
jgi:hypothetical protein